ncbi:hypothetical protein A3860_38770 [Niastella vici]|uniref:Iron dicitrate transport regulator FecR n=1 Tax=Niastella vici TaxID=1703345 RepID=A0A1V9FL98_9BACT|nr:FecR family protein [Niastella vici]OQP59115.1 hypothetical protein A3860_38770 [Niastella vici]
MQDEHLFIAGLLQKYPDLNQEEQEQLNRWLEQGNNRNYFNQILDKGILEEDLRQLDQLKTESRQSWEKLLRLKQGQAKVFRLKNSVFYAAAAAAIIIIISSIVFFKLNQTKKENDLVVQGSKVPVVTDVKPGQYKARLTLADGSSVVLDSFSNARLVQQGSTNVFTKDGQLVYQRQGKQNEEALYNTLTTAKGETYGMTLSDGSMVWLNSQSSIRYPVAFNNEIRKVEITGEAYFEVATAYSISGSGQKRKQRFVVSLNGVDVEVLGTKFNVNSYTNENTVKTTLLEGKVKVHSSTNNTETTLQPGQQATWNKQSQQINKLDDVDVDEAVAWHYGYFQFNDADLETVLRQLVRWYDVEVVYQGNIPQREFWGKISRKNTLSQVLETLEKNNVHFKLEGKRIVVAP